jgi:hypothetical protein
MKRRLFVLFTVAIMLLGVTADATYAFNGHGGGGHGGGHSGGHSGGHGFGRGFGRGFGGIGFVGGGGDCGWDIADLYNQLYNNLPYFALHPPVYYSCPVPRTYGYSPFAYPPGVMTPDFVTGPIPMTINNPYTPAIKNPAAPAMSPSSDSSATATPVVEPLVIVNPFVTQRGTVATNVE